MSAGLSRFRGLRGSGGSPPTPTPPGSVGELLMGTPSMTYNGSLLALIEVPPRIRTCAPDPGSPLFGMMLTPAAPPRIIVATFLSTPAVALVAFNQAIRVM